MERLNEMIGRDGPDRCTDAIGTDSGDVNNHRSEATLIELMMTDIIHIVKAQGEARRRPFFAFLSVQE